MKLKLRKEFGFETISTLGHATNAIDLGEMLQLASNVVTPITAVSNDTTFIGISGSEQVSGDGGRWIIIYTECFCDATLASATYTFGDALKWETANSLEADGGANTIAWFWDLNLSGVATTSGLVKFSLMHTCLGAAVSADRLVKLNAD